MVTPIDLSKLLALVTGGGGGGGGRDAGEAGRLQIFVIFPVSFSPVKVEPLIMELANSELTKSLYLANIF